MDDPNFNAPDDASLEARTGADESDPQNLVGTVVADRYKVEVLLGQGAMGAVYRAQHIHMQKAVALKVLHQSMSSNQEVVRRFEREAIAAGRVEHPNVATATDFGRLKDGSFYLVLEFIDGKSLGQLMEETGPMPVERACRITGQIAAALSAAHAAGIVHRDLKPENVMLPQGDHEGDIVKVLDFGMAKLQQADSSETKLTMHGAVYGTPQYMAPEQASGQDVDQRADLYAVGLMLYEMLAGKPPFEADQMMALLLKHMTEKVPPLPSTVPRPIAKLVMSLLEKKPEDRPQSAAEVLDALGEFLGTSFQDPRMSMSMVGMPSPRGRQPSTAAVFGDQVAEQVAKVAPLIGKARAASRPAIEFLQQPMSVKGKTFPRWVPAAGLAGFVIVLLFILMSGDSEPLEGETLVAATTDTSGVKELQDAKPAERDPDPPSPELAKVIESAALYGSDAGLYALEQRSDSERSLTEWMGLAQARLMRKQTKKALEAFRAAIKMDGRMATDKRLLGALRRLADEDEYADDILTFAAEDMGSLGADFLFHVWSKTSLKTKATTIAFDKLTSAAVERNYSPELKVAMSLRNAESCEDFLKLMPEVERVGDDRSLTRLRTLAKERGCGPSERQDCYPCLRKGKELRNAMQAAGMRNSLQFELSRWEWKQ